MKCANCGVELEPEARFCQDCGTPVGKTKTQAKADSPEAAETAEISEAMQASGKDSARSATRKPKRSAPKVARIAPGVTRFKPARVEVGKRKASGQHIAIGVICISLIVAAVFSAATFLGLGKTSSQDSSASASAVSQGESSENSSTSGSSASSSASSSATSSSKSAKSKKSKKKKGFDQTEAEAKARKEAVAAGMQLFSGTIRVTTYGARAEAVAKHKSSFKNVAGEELVLLDFSLAETVTAAIADDMYTIETRQNQDSLALGNPSAWEEFDGQLVTVAAFAQDIVFPNDAATELYSALGNATLVAPLTEQRAADLAFYTQGIPQLMELPKVEDSSSKSSASASAAAAGNGSYILPDSASRIYSKTELNGLSDYELFVARNEIYARHGRMFQSKDLQDYFNGKSWYHGTSSATAFDESVLSETEIANASLIYEIEKSRNSKYV